MYRHYLLPAILLLVASCQAQSPKSAGGGTFTLRSADVGGQATEQQVFNGFGCSGKNQSPQLSWENAPADTKSFAITMYDPDAPTGSGWWHWVVFDIPATTTALPAGAGTPGQTGLPAGVLQGMTDFGAPGYGGPCPPPGHGPHQYIVTVYALDTEKLGLPDNAGAPMVGFNLTQHMLAKASIVFYYGR
ncbi:MAG: YbhB/YbcL family Raf kinase inhibitor-like protein [Flavobacteriales bacterium]|nr:YbhB/YbcL family Raf kinase inhibitor-like protein [Flavobacteriales bacterium]